jgi:arsenite-transporting ATPase
MQFLENAPPFLFFTGKGGVGKTSIACATALSLSRDGKRVLLVSTDPASNVGHVFGQTIGNTVTAIDAVPGLSALEINPEQAAQQYREKIVGPMRGILPDAELGLITESLSGSCTTEIAAFDEFTDLLADPDVSREYDHVIFDTAPTGHTIRMLQLPGAWTDFLSEGKGDASCLGPLAGLDKHKDTYARAVNVLRDPALTRLVLVARAQASALGEVERTYGELAEIGIGNAHLVVNGVMPATAREDPLVTALREREREAMGAVPAAIAALPRDTVELKAQNMVGLEALAGLLAPATPDAAHEPEHASDGTTPTGTETLASMVDEFERDGHGLIMCVGKGGVGKTTVAAAVAVALAGRGHVVHLTTTDPAAHLSDALGDDVPGLTVSRIDPQAATLDYRERVMATKGKNLDEAGRAALTEDLLSPCTEEVAVFQQFSRIVSKSRKSFVVMDTAPTGHTLLLLDATGSYHREIARNMGEGATFTTPMMQLQDPQQTKVLIVTLAETTPVLEAARLQADLRRAGIEPWGWVANQSVAAAQPRSPFLRQRAAGEHAELARVRELAPRTAVVPLLAAEPVGVDRLRQLTEELSPVR